MDPDRTAVLALVAASVGLVAWAGWRAVTAASPLLGTVLIVGSVAVAASAVPAAAVCLAVRRRWPPNPGAVAGLSVGAVGLVLVGWGAVMAALPSWSGVADAIGSVVALLAFTVWVPLAVGWLIADRLRVAYRLVVMAWPVSLIVGVLLFLAPGAGGVEFVRYNATFLDEPWRTVVFALIALVVALGPVGIAAGVGGPADPRRRRDRAR